MSHPSSSDKLLTGWISRLNKFGWGAAETSRAADQSWGLFPRDDFDGHLRICKLNARTDANPDNEAMAADVARRAEKGDVLCMKAMLVVVQDRLSS